MAWEIAGMEALGLTVEEYPGFWKEGSIIGIT